MIGPGMKKLAGEFHFRTGNGCAYGNIDEYLVTFGEGVGFKEVYISYSLNNEEGEEKRRRLSEFIGSKKTEYRIIGFDVGGTGVSIKFFDNVGTLKKMKAFLKDIIGLLKSLDVSGVSHCCYCGEALNPENSRIIRINGMFRKCDNQCASAAFNHQIEKQERFENTENNYGKGILGAFLGMVVGIIPWIIIYMLGYIAGFAGYLIGICSKKGYEMLGGKAGSVKLATVIIISILGVSLAQFISYSLSYCYDMAKSGYPLDFITSMSDVAYYLTTESEVVSEFLLNLLMGYLFAGLGLISVIRDMVAERKSVKPDFQITE